MNIVAYNHHFLFLILLQNPKMDRIIKNYNHEIPKKYKMEQHLNDSILRTFGALGIFINREVAKNDIRLLASRFDGIYIAVSSTVSNKRKRLTCHPKNGTFWSLAETYSK